METLQRQKVNQKDEKEKKDQEIGLEVLNKVNQTKLVKEIF